MSNSKYIGITIGPIFDTINKAQKTREIWGASYLFSYICKEILKKIKVSDYTILLPDTSQINATQPGVGLFPDRILMRTKGSGNFDDVNKIIKEVKLSVSEKLWNELDKSFSFNEYQSQINCLKTKKVEVKAFFYDYFKTYAIEADSEDLCFTDKEDKNIGEVKSLNLYLDNAEFMPTLAHFDPDPFFVLFHFINHSFLTKDAFGAINKQGFPSLTEISTNELQFVKDNENNFLYQKEIRKIIEEDLESLKNKDDTIDEIGGGDSLAKIFAINGIKNHLRTYHKYIAIVHADGDNMGKLIGTLKEDVDVQNFSKDLVEFAVQANKILAGERFTNGSKTNWGYGAAPIYIGGDDLVFFAPIATIDTNNGYKTIFDLVDALDKCFNKIFNKPEKTDENGEILEYKKYKSLTIDRPCLTYGISITYYKFPLRQAYEQSKELMYAVKNNTYATRNRIHFVLQKHSRQSYYGVIDKNFKIVFEKYRNLLTKSIANELTGEKSEKFLNSIYKNIIENDGQYLDSNIPDLKNLFKANFNEKVHKEFEDYLEEVRIWIELMFKNQGYSRETLDTIISMLKFIHFIRDNEFRN